MRHREHDLHAAARGNRAHAEREIRACPRDPRPLQRHRPAIRSLRQRAVPHAGDRSRMGRDSPIVDRAHRSRRRIHRQICRHGHRSAACRQAARPARDRTVRRQELPHQPLGLWLYRRHARRRADDRAGGQARGGDRHRRDRGPGGAQCRARCEGTAGVPADAVERGRAQQPPAHPRLVRRGCRARLAEEMAGELRRQSGHRLPCRRPGRRWLDRSRQAHPCAGDRHAARAAYARRHHGRFRGCR